MTWTGGIANREWNRGTPAPAPFVRRDSEIAVAVGTYLRECRQFAHLLRAADHPTEHGMLQVTWCRTDTEREQARVVFARLMARRRQ